MTNDYSNSVANAAGMIWSMAGTTYTLQSASIQITIGYYNVWSSNTFGFGYTTSSSSITITNLTFPGTPTRMSMNGEPSQISGFFWGVTSTPITITTMTYAFTSTQYGYAYYNAALFAYSLTSSPVTFTNINIAGTVTWSNVVSTFTYVASSPITSTNVTIAMTSNYHNWASGYLGSVSGASNQIINKLYITFTIAGDHYSYSYGFTHDINTPTMTI